MGEPGGAALCLAGCTGFWDLAISTGGGGGTTTLTSGDFYVLNIATSQMVGLYVNAGTLTALPGSPYTLVCCSDRHHRRAE